MDEELLTTKEVAERFRVSMQTIRDMIRDGRLTAVRFGRQFRIPKSALEKAIKQVSREEQKSEPEAKE